MEKINSKYLITEQKLPQAPKNATTAPNSGSNLKIFYTNDWHGQTDNMGGILGASLQFDSATKGSKFDTLKLCAGDSYSGANGEKNKLIVNLLNYMKFDACALGNHEFDSGEEEAGKAINSSKHTKFISSNLKTNSEHLKGIESTFVKEINGNKYGVIGLSPIDLKTVVAQEKLPNTDVLSLEETIKNTQIEIDKMKSQGINKIVLLSHIGKDLDEKLASSLDGVDIIVGGHSHDVISGIEEEENLVRSKSGEPVVILQTGENAENYGIFEAEFDANGLLVKVANSVIETGKKKNSIVDKIKDDEIGKSPTIATIKEIDPMPHNRRIKPCAWTELVADAVKSELGVDVALINSANIRKVPQIGKLTERDVEESSPMKNSLLKVEMSEKDIVEAVKMAAERTLSATDGYPGLLQGAGITYEIDSNGKLLDMAIGDKKVDINNPTDKKFTVAIDSFVANGKEYPELVPKKVIETFDFDKDTLAINHIKKNQTEEGLVIKDDGRLKITQTSQILPKNNNTRNI